LGRRADERGAGGVRVRGESMLLCVDACGELFRERDRERERARARERERENERARARERESERASERARKRERGKRVADPCPASSVREREREREKRERGQREKEGRERQTHAAPVLLEREARAPIRGHDLPPRETFIIRFRANMEQLEGFKDFYLKAKAESGVDCLMFCCIFAGQQLHIHSSSCSDV